MTISELDEVKFVGNVKCGGENTSLVKVTPTSMWVGASVDGGIITVKHKTGAVVYVPLTNVAYFQPRAERAAPIAIAPLPVEPKAKAKK